jgi:3-dehydroquinate synthase
MKQALLELGERSYPIWIGEGIVAEAVRAFSQKHPKCRKAFVLADKRVNKISNVVIAELKAQGWTVHLQRFAVSEALKDFKRTLPIYAKLLAGGADRHSVVFAVGGGVIGDLAGFVAATYHRGMRWVGVPTTLLAQVDSSIGGKTGVNHPLGKNLIGAFHQPSAVICELSALRTLPKRDRASGLGEILKYSLIGNRPFFDYCRANLPRLLELDPTALAWAVTVCAEQKARVVERDELDRTGLRESLNFGHTVGHALEAIANYKGYRHGEAVLVGMRAALRLSVVRGHLDSTAMREMDDLLALVPLPPFPKSVPARKLLQYVRRDKKQESGKTRFVLLKGVGLMVPDTDVTDAEILQVVKELQEEYR